MKQNGGICGPDGAISHYELVAEEGARTVITFGSTERPGASPMYRDELLHHLQHPYHVEKPEGGWRDRASFTPEEKAKLRPIAETLAMLDGNAFFGMEHGGGEHYEGYLPEAHALYEANGGDTGWAGEASFAKPKS